MGVPAFVVGLVFGLLWDRYRDFAVLVALHAGIDTLPGVWLFLGVTH
jgi:membrane protease YdiL (CAAX protease family)